MNTNSRIKQLLIRLKSSTNLRNGITFTIFAFLNNGANFVLIMILATYLSPDGYGSLNLFNTAMLIMTILIPLGTTGYIGNSYFRKDKKGFKQVLDAISSIGVCIFLCSLLTFTLIGKNLEPLLGLSAKFQIIASIICFSQLFTTINLEVWRLQEKPTKYGIYTMGMVALNCLLTLYFIIICDLDWEGRIYAQLLVNVGFFIVSIIFLLKRKLILQTRISKYTISETLIFGIPLIPHMLTGWMRQGLDRYIINVFLGVGSVGIFSFALNFGNIILMVGTAFNASNAVFIYKKLASKDLDTKQVLIKQTRMMIAFFLGLFILIFMCSFILTPFVFPQYIDSRPLLFPLCLSATFQCIYLLYVNYLFFYKKTKRLMCITVGISLLHITLSYLLSKYSILYTAYINLFSNFGICLLVASYARKYRKR